MKKIVRILMLLSVVSLFAVTSNYAQQIVVRVRPERPHNFHHRRPPQPSHHHVWIAEEWIPSGGTYVYKPGFWAMPPHPHAIWITGHWRHRHGGYIWIPGYWR